MNIYDVSKRAGVSIATVSRVINNSEGVSEKTRKKVLDAIEELEYIPNALARGLGINSMKTIGIMCANASDIYLANAIYHLESSLRKFGYDCILCCTGYESDIREKYMTLLLSKQVDAVILVGSNYVEEDVAKQEYIHNAAKKVPIVLVNGQLEGENIYCSLADDYQAVFQLCTQLIQKGKKNLMFLYDSNSFSGKQKRQGYEDALKNYNLKPNQLFIPFDEDNIQKIKDFIVQEVREYPEAMICCEDAIAVASLKFATKVGLDVPNQLHIVGYNNSLIAKCCEPELTSIDNKVQEVCDSAIKMLMNVLEGNGNENIKVVPCFLKQRGTTDF
ncbi:LacI family DNA-binding transcriptional regulator [Niameybacter massiliensis]|uniref:LacI family DNA-binding transcriptional regulator n=1 Tax=Holtiella tumoricola TaxID=3018743 RepID=A0AA42DNR8_9FIRM|nr:LacI family DNA-binding transcriptional regulator [Holtiella tumoricola]MDA3732727.1 LacI family DNA-binding transcriptional regulator [Holtiella tumoricola]